MHFEIPALLTPQSWPAVRTNKILVNRLSYIHVCTNIFQLFGENVFVSNNQNQLIEQVNKSWLVLVTVLLF